MSEMAKWRRVSWGSMQPGDRVRLTDSASGDVFHGEAREGNFCMSVCGRLDYAFEDHWDIVEIAA